MQGEWRVNREASSPAVPCIFIPIYLKILLEYTYYSKHAFMQTKRDESFLDKKRSKKRNSKHEKKQEKDMYNFTTSLFCRSFIDQCHEITLTRFHE